MVLVGGLSLGIFGAEPLVDLFILCFLIPLIRFPSLKIRGDPPLLFSLSLPLNTVYYPLEAVSSVWELSGYNHLSNEGYPRPLEVQAQTNHLQWTSVGVVSLLRSELPNGKPGLTHYGYTELRIMHRSIQMPLAPNFTCTEKREKNKKKR